ncbi:MAG: ribonuclease P protein component [Patescibacteria group bacterium]
MLPARYRLTKDQDFKKINALGRAFFSTYFRVKYLANKLSYSRLAVVVSTKVSKKSTKRNRLKRQLREIIRLNRQKIKAGYDVVVSPSSRALTANYQVLEKNLLDLFTKAKLLK